jgi:hypothetical protein
VCVDVYIYNIAFRVFVMLKQICVVGDMVEKRKYICSIFVVLALLILQFMTIGHGNNNGFDSSYLIVFAIMSFLLV